MAFVDSDWSITRSNGNIRYIGDLHGGASPSYATVLELHRALQDFADNATSTGDDELDITDANPSIRDTNNIIRLINGYNIDAASAEYLYDGSIVQNGGDDVFDGFANFGNAASFQVLQNGAILSNDFWNTTAHKAASANTTLGISSRFLIPVRTGGTDIDGRRLIGLARNFGKSYREFSVNGSQNGNNTLALSEEDDINNQTASGTVATWTTVAKTEGYQLLDIDGDSVGEPYYIQWTKGSQSLNDTYERVKYLTRDGTSDTLFGLNGLVFRGITHEIPYSSLAGGTFTEGSDVTIGTATCRVLADDGSATMWVQKLTGPDPVSSDSMTQGGVTATAGSVVTRTVPTGSSVLGQSTGTSILGAFGVGFDPNDVFKDDDFTDLTGTLQEPPNNVSFSVSNLVVGDNVFVAPSTAFGSTTVDESQLTLSTSLTGVTSSVVVTTAIPTDTPSSGTIRVQSDAGNYLRVPYLSYSGSTFTINSTDFTSTPATNPKNVYVSYLDLFATGTTASFTSVYSGADRELVVLVRNSTIPIKEYLAAGTLGSGGGSSSTIRQSDA